MNLGKQLAPGVEPTAGQWGSCVGTRRSHPTSSPLQKSQKGQRSSVSQKKTPKKISSGSKWHATQQGEDRDGRQQGHGGHEMFIRRLRELLHGEEEHQWSHHHRHHRPHPWRTTNLHCPWTPWAPGPEEPSQPLLALLWHGSEAKRHHMVQRDLNVVQCLASYVAIRILTTSTHVLAPSHAPPKLR